MSEASKGAEVIHFGKITETPEAELRAQTPDRKWWDPRYKGTLGSYVTRLGIAAVATLFVGNSLVDRAVDAGSAALVTPVNNNINDRSRELTTPVTQALTNLEERAAAAEDLAHGVRCDSISIKVALERDLGMEFPRTEEQIKQERELCPFLFPEEGLPEDNAAPVTPTTLGQ